jgi:hypothetical protein
MSLVKLDTNKISTERLEEIRSMISQIKYGSITLIIQDGIIVQVDKNEKIRIK